jgi:hypothetical protein
MANILDLCCEVLSLFTYIVPPMNDPMDKKSFELHPQPDVLLNLMEEFTGIYKDSAHLSATQREARCEKVHWKAKVRPIRGNELFAGRMVQAPIGYPGQTDGSSMGYCLHSEAMESLKINPGLSQENMERLDALLAIWEDKTTVVKARQAFTPEMKQALPSDLYYSEPGIAFTLWRMADHQAFSSDSQERIAELREMARILRKISSHPPDTFREGLQLMFLYTMLDGVRNYGQMDDYLGRLYAADIDSGRLDEEEAIHAIQYGCREYVLNHRSVGAPSGVINLLQALIVTLHRGYDPVSGKAMGMPGDRYDKYGRFDSFEYLLNAYKEQVEYHTIQLARYEELEYIQAGRDNAYLCTRMLMDDCLDREKAIFSEGIWYLGETLETYGNVNTSGSLLAFRYMNPRQTRCM